MRVLLEGATAEIVEKRSRFIAQTAAVRTEDEAAAFLDGIRKKFWDARHHCSAYVLSAAGGAQPVTHSSDDGEPSGTAGRPILDVITGFELVGAMVVVTRYFGGTLLGTGGLVRAYGSAAKAGLEASLTAEKVDGSILSVRAGYDCIGKLQYIAAAAGLVQADAEYAGDVTLSYYVPDAEKAPFIHAVTEATAGRAAIEDLGEISFAAAGGEIILL